jgi:hypothetical protein
VDADIERKALSALDFLSQEIRLPAPCQTILQPLAQVRVLAAQVRMPSAAPMAYAAMVMPSKTKSGHSVRITGL